MFRMLSRNHFKRVVYLLCLSYCMLHITLYFAYLPVMKLSTSATFQVNYLRIINILILFGAYLGLMVNVYVYSYILLFRMSVYGFK